MMMNKEFVNTDLFQWKISIFLTYEASIPLLILLCVILCLYPVPIISLLMLRSSLWWSLLIRLHSLLTELGMELRSSWVYYLLNESWAIGLDPWTGFGVGWNPPPIIAPPESCVSRVVIQVWCWFHLWCCIHDRWFMIFKTNVSGFVILLCFFFYSFIFGKPLGWH